MGILEKQLERYINSEMRGNEMDKRKVIEQFNDYLLKTQQPYMYEETKRAVKMGILSMEKLEKIEHIINSEIERGDCVLHCNLTRKIREVLENE